MAYEKNGMKSDESSDTDYTGKGPALSGDDRKMKSNKSSGGSLDTGLSSQQSLDQGYRPRSSGQGQRPSSPTVEKVGKFKIC